MLMRIHLDLLGGLAGDMFIASVLDAFPQHEPAMLESIATAAPATGAQGLSCRLIPHHDGVLQGRRFEVDDPANTAANERGVRHHDHDHDHDHDHGAVHDHSFGSPGHGRSSAEHGHTPWRSIRAGLEESALPEGVRRQAIGIFAVLAEAEAKVHGVAVDAVAFHEVGARDSIADVVGAAHLIDALSATRWTVSAVPLGFGRVRTAHGPMPVPAPATALLLQGFKTLDDGIGGERVTPTGAAILRHLCAGAVLTGGAPRTVGTLCASGVGFGTRRLPGISNCVRVLAFEDGVAASGGNHRQLAVIEFEVDDQSAEDLAMGLEHLRAHPAIFDVVQSPVFGKKGRMMTAVRALASPTGLDAAIEACFRETTTIGLRHRAVNGSALPRRQHEVALEGATMRVKTVARPGGATAKTESDDVAALTGHASRRALRAQAEALALQPAGAAVPEDGQ